MDGASGNKELFFTLALQYPVPKPVSFSYDDCYLSHSAGSTAPGCVYVSSRENCADSYDGSPKDYYYLPAEDIAVHKSIASAVDKEHRVQANASNCYGKKYAIFLPQYDAMFSPVFREQPRGGKCHFELSADFAADPAMQTDYVTPSVRNHAFPPQISVWREALIKLSKKRQARIWHLLHSFFPAAFLLYRKMRPLK